MDRADLDDRHDPPLDPATMGVGCRHGDCSPDVPPACYNGPAVGKACAPV